MTVSTFQRVVAAIYGIAFLSFGVQAQGLIGSRGILPARDFLKVVHDALGAGAWRQLPTLLWLDASDRMILAIWISGALFALLAVIGIWQRVSLTACLVLWLSICTAGQDFLGFQWDALLLETGLLAIFADDSRGRIWLFRWLAFRLIFSSGAVKLLSGDPTWRNGTALTYHYWTQPLPTPLAWYMQQLPRAFQLTSTWVMFAIELLAPFLFFCPRRFRQIGAWANIGLQVLILLTGNYTYFNLLTLALLLFLFIEPDPKPRRLPHRFTTAALVLTYGFASLMVVFEMFNVTMLPGGAQLLRALAPYRVVNQYGLFAVMTTTRPEIIVEGSDDGLEWRAYEFRFKPGDVRRAPPVVAPYQPRLDWQMWFAALGTYEQNRWFGNFLYRIGHGERSVLGLLRYNPFPKTPPRYLRARVFQYHFTKWGEPGWWKREEEGIYFPAVAVR